MAQVPESRIRPLNTRPSRPNGAYVLYWMIASRRPTWNFALQRAIEWAQHFHRPLLILEPLSCTTPWASDRLHRFILEGMADNARHFQEQLVTYYPYVEPAPGDGDGLLAFLARHACLVVSDDFPCFIIPGMLQEAAATLDVPLEAVDSNGIFPMRATETLYPSAYAFRRALQKVLPGYLLEKPDSDPLHGKRLRTLPALPQELVERWPACPTNRLQRPESVLADLPIDHQIPAGIQRGGSRAAEATLAGFLSEKLARYAECRNEPGLDVTSGLSPYLHFGHISTHRICDDLLRLKNWSPGCLAEKPRGQKEGWWGLDASAEAFLDQLITWRELGFNMCALNPHYDRYESLPLWARQTLEAHEEDPRPYLYSLEEFAHGATHDPLWNAAQKQLLREGRLHNYLRMLWGKKILEWTRHPREALAVMIELNNRFALDGRDPNSYSGIFWCLGRYDRPWGERGIFGKVRYMSSERTAKKVDVREFLQRYA